jgi:hypothetical protein
MPIAKPSKVCTTAGVTGKPRAVAGTYQSCLRLRTVARIDKSARPARSSRTKCSGKVETVLSYAPGGTVIGLLSRFPIGLSAQVNAVIGSPRSVVIARFRLGDIFSIFAA